MRYQLAGILIAIALLIGPTTPASARAPHADHPGLIPAECPPIGADGFTFTCGYVDVPADHTNPDGPKYQIAVVIAHLDGVDAPPDPILYVNGGPGSKTLGMLPFYLDRLYPYLQDRDIVFFDIRGIGLSKPALECPEMAELFGSEGDPDVRARLFEAAQTCHDRLETEGIDLSLFNSAQTAGDIATLRDALGYQQWNLYGISYGTRTAFDALRDHPEGIRAAVLDAVVPPEADLLAGQPANLEASIDRLVAACGLDFLCRTTYPDLKARLVRLIHRLDERPYSLTITLSDGTRKVSQIDGAGFSGMLGSLTANADGLGSIPAVVADAERGDFSAWEGYFKQIGEAQQDASQNPTTPGQSFSVICAEEMPFTSGAEIAASFAAHPLSGDPRDEIHLSDYCDHWPVTALGQIESRPVSSDVPVLLVNGEYDALASPHYMESAAKTLPNSTVIVLPATGHGIAGVGCPNGIVRRFLDDPVHPVDTSCVGGMPASPRWVIGIDISRGPANLLAKVLLPAAAILAGFGAGAAARMAMRGQISWRMAFQRVGWWGVPAGLGASVAIEAFALVMGWDMSVVAAMGLGISLVAAIQTALALAPSDEPALEVVLALPQPFALMKLAQIVALLAAHLLAALAVTAILDAISGSDFNVYSLVWIAPTIFLCGLAALVTANSQQSGAGVLVAVLAAFGLALGGDNLLPARAFGSPWPPPANLVQMVLWAVNPYLNPTALTEPDFLANQVITITLGLLMLAGALRLLSNGERVLMASQEQ